MYQPRLLKGKAAPKDNYNKDIIFIFLPPPLLPFFLSSPLFSFPSFKTSPAFPSSPFFFPSPFFFSLLFFFPSHPFFFLLGRCVYRPREINFNLT